MQDIIYIFVTFGLVVVDIVVALLYADAIQMLLEKDLRCVFFFLMWIGILLLQTGLFSWLPGRTGSEISMLDGLIVFEDGALVRNFGSLLFVHAAGIGMSIAKNLWEVIRRRARFYGKLFLLQVATCALFGYLGIVLMENGYTVHFQGGEKAGSAVLLVIAAVGAGLILFAIFSGKSDKKDASAQGTAQGSGQGTAQGSGRGTTRGSAQGSSSGSSKEPSAEAVARFEQIAAERKRMMASGDAASLIPLLIEATSLDLDSARKARIWNYLGMAYNEISSPEKCVECYRTAQRTDPDSPSAYNNLAMYQVDRKEYGEALRNMELAVQKAEKRRMNAGNFYANYALAAGLNGDLNSARKYLDLSEKAGYESGEIASIRRRLGI